MSKLARTKNDKVFDVLNTLFFVIVLVVILYPLYFVVIASISDPSAVNTGQVLFWPKDITLEGYKAIMEHEALIRGFMNSVKYTFVGTIVNVVLTITAGYALSRKDLVGRDKIMMFILFTMFFSGGLIPTYLLVRNLGLIDTMWAVILPGAVSAYNLIIVRTFFQSNISQSLLEAAKIDGATNFQFFFKIAIPLSAPIIAVMILFHAVGHWNQYFDALIYLRNTALHPLQLVLRDILVLEQTKEIMEQGAMIDGMQQQQQLADLIKYGVVVVASLPMLVIYPFVQKHFVKGVMIGSVKG